MCIRSLISGTDLWPLPLTIASIINNPCTKLCWLWFLSWSCCHGYTCLDIPPDSMDAIKIDASKRKQQQTPVIVVLLYLDAVICYCKCMETCYCGNPRRIIQVQALYLIYMDRCDCWDPWLPIKGLFIYHYRVIQWQTVTMCYVWLIGPVLVPPPRHNVLSVPGYRWGNSFPQCTLGITFIYIACQSKMLTWPIFLHNHSFYHTCRQLSWYLNERSFDEELESGISLY